jgi:hypothetical protein
MLDKKTPTPETDKWSGGSHVVPTDFARELERDRDQWKRMYEEADWRTVEAEVFKSERDKARDTVLRLRKQRAITLNFGEQMERERNELRLDQINHENLSMRYMDERDQWRECAEELAKWVRSRASFDLDALEALNEFERLKEGR